MSFLLTVNVSTNTQFQAGNPAVVATAISDYLNHQSGLLSGVGTGLAVGETLNFIFINDGSLLLICF